MFIDVACDGELMICWFDKPAFARLGLPDSCRWDAMRWIFGPKFMDSNRGLDFRMPVPFTSLARCALDRFVSGDFWGLVKLGPDSMHCLGGSRFIGNLQRRHIATSSAPCTSIARLIM